MIFFNLIFISKKSITFKIISFNIIQNHIGIQIEGNSEPIIIAKETLPTKNTFFQRGLESLFNNENIKLLRGMEQTKKVVSKIINLSIADRILTPYIGLVGVQMVSSTYI